MSPPKPTSTSIHQHNPYALLSETTDSSQPTTGTNTSPFALLILNQPINIPALQFLLPRASLLVCADGGANRLHTYHTTSSTPYTQRPPDAIIGDLDSLSSEAEHYYKLLGVEIYHDPDQYSTDFTKSLKYLRRYWDENKGKGERLDVIALGGLGGRVDQGFSQIHHMYLAVKDPELLLGRIYLLSDQSLSFILEMGVNEICVGPLYGGDSETGVFNECVGVVPVMGPAKISLQGFEWDVDDWDTEFGGQMSTSNHLRKEKVIVDVKSGGQCLFTLELADNLCLSSRP